MTKPELEISKNAEGEIFIDYYTGKGQMLTICIEPNNLLSYSFFHKEFKDRGSVDLNNLEIEDD